MLLIASTCYRGAPRTPIQIECVAIIVDHSTPNTVVAGGVGYARVPSTPLPYFGYHAQPRAPGAHHGLITRAWLRAEDPGLVRPSLGRAVSLGLFLQLSLLRTVVNRTLLLA